MTLVKKISLAVQTVLIQFTKLNQLKQKGFIFFFQSAMLRKPHPPTSHNKIKSKEVTNVVPFGKESNENYQMDYFRDY